MTLVSFQPMRRAVHHWQARSLTCSSADCVSAADLHVGLKLTAVQLFPEMLAQRRLANLKLSGYLGLGDAKSRSTLNKRALGIGRLIFGGHFTFPIAQPRDARALGEKAGCRGKDGERTARRMLNGSFVTECAGSMGYE